MVYFNANLIYNKEIGFTVGVKHKKHTHRARTHERTHTRTNARTYFIDKSNVWYSDPTLTLLLNFAFKIQLQNFYFFEDCLDIDQACYTVQTRARYSLRLN